MRNSITAGRARPRQRKSRSSERAERPKCRGSDGCSRWGMPRRVQEVGEQRRVFLRPRHQHAHVLEGHAARGLPQQAPHDAAHLGRFAGRGHQLDGVVGDRVSGRRLEQRRAQPRDRGRDVRRRQRSERGLARSAPRPIPWRSAHAPKEWARSPGGTSWSRRRTGRAAASAARNAFSVPLGSRSSTISTSASCSHRARATSPAAASARAAVSAKRPVDRGVEPAEQPRHRGQRSLARGARARRHRIQVARAARLRAADRRACAPARGPAGGGEGPPPPRGRRRRRAAAARRARRGRSPRPPARGRGARARRGRAAGRAGSAGRGR